MRNKRIIVLGLILLFLVIYAGLLIAEGGKASLAVPSMLLLMVDGLPLALIILFFVFAYKRSKGQTKVQRVTSVVGITLLGGFIALLSSGILFFIFILLFANQGLQDVGDYEYPVTRKYKLTSLSEDQAALVIPGEYSSSHHYPNSSVTVGVPLAIIPDKIVAIVWNDQFIIAKRQEVFMSDMNDLIPSVDFPVDIVPNLFDYWIVDVNNDQVYGHLTEDEFLEKRHAFNIPSELVMRPPSEFKK
jgi:hypothetical protein